ncbi:uncharacterized [Tachysurus ichikawai]
MNEADGVSHRGDREEPNPCSPLLPDAPRPPGKWCLLPSRKSVSGRKSHWEEVGKNMKQAESRTGGFDEVLADFPTLPRRKQAVTAGHQEAPGHLLGEPWSSEEGRGYTVIPSPINILAFSERAAPQVPQWCSNAEEKGSVGMFCTFFRI